VLEELWAWILCEKMRIFGEGRGWGNWFLLGRG